MSELTEAAKTAIADAVRIVREDKQFAMLREVHSRTFVTPPTPEPEPTPEPVPVPKPKATPPPAKDPVPEPEPEPANRSAYWGVWE